MNHCVCIESTSAVRPDGRPAIQRRSSAALSVRKKVNDPICAARDVGSQPVLMVHLANDRVYANAPESTAAAYCLRP